MLQTADTEIRYNVHCFNCDEVFQPTQRTSLWWQAQQRIEKGFIDALPITGEEHGCVTSFKKPSANIRVFGYNDLCENFDIPCGTFLEAIRTYRRLKIERMNIVFIIGVSKTVMEKLSCM